MSHEAIIHSIWYPIYDCIASYFLWLLMDVLVNTFFVSFVFFFFSGAYVEIILWNKCGYIIKYIYIKYLIFKITMQEWFPKWIYEISALSTVDIYCFSILSPTLKITEFLKCQAGVFLVRFALYFLDK